MNAPAAPSQDIIDVRKIRRLVNLMKEHDLAEIDLQQGEVRIRLRRGPIGSPTVASAPPIVTVTAPAPAGRPAAESVVPTAEAADKGVTVVKSPMVGTFYAAPDPDSPPFVKVGDHIGPETIVCIVEAMKVFNQIPAEASGRIISVLVENGAPVEFGQPLFRVDAQG
jgi:acetyl-CoA carboxylase biotin carboxyl carrier protein